MGMAELSQPIPPTRRLEYESAPSCRLPHKSPWQNLGHAEQAIPPAKQLAQAHSLRLLEQQSSEQSGFCGNS